MPITNAAGEFLSGAIIAPATGNFFAGPMSSFSIIGNYVAPMGMIGFQETAGLLVTGAIDAEVWDTTRRFLGFIGDPLQASDFTLTTIGVAGGADLNINNINRPMTVNDRYIQFHKHLPSPDELNVMFNRDLITQRLYDFSMRQVLDGENGFARAFEQLRFEIPGPSDLIHFAVRNCFNAELVSTFELNKELPIAILPYMKANGLHGLVNIPMPAGATTTLGNDIRQQPQWFDLHWWSHWVLPGVGQVYTMLQRLYPKSPYGPSPLIEEFGALTFNQAEAFLRENDYSPFWRSKLIGISFNPLTRVDVRRLYDMEVISEAEVYHAYRQQGYDDTNAQHLTDFTKQLTIEKRLAQVRQKAYKELHESYQLGILTKADAIEQLTAFGIRQDVANSYVSVWDVEFKKNRFKQTINAVKAGFMLGTLSESQVQSAMQSIGVDAATRTVWINDWKFIRYTKRKFISASLAKTAYLDNLLTRNQYAFRLQNLNFDNADIPGILMIADIERSKRLGKAVEQALKEQEKQYQHKIKKMLEPYTDTNIKAMWKAKQLSLTQIRNILTMKGWTTEAIIEWMNTYLGAANDQTTQTTSETTTTTTTESPTP